jgi:hypothetical protein
VNDCPPIPPINHCCRLKEAREGRSVATLRNPSFVTAKWVDTKLNQAALYQPSDFPLSFE